MIISEKFINHYFPESIKNFKTEYFRLFDFEIQSNIDAPVKGWKYMYIGKELTDIQMKKINEYFIKYIAPKIRVNKNTLFDINDKVTNLSFNDLENVKL